MQIIFVIMADRFSFGSFELCGLKICNLATSEAVVFCSSGEFPPEHCTSKKIYRLKEDQAFSLSLELGRREKVARQSSADFLLPSVGGGGDFVDTVNEVKML
jgi:hypothetical protein